MSSQAFVHLRVHSSFSLLEGALTIGKLAKLAGYYRMPAVAVHGTRANLKVADVVAELEALLVDWRTVLVERPTPLGGGK